MPSAKSTLPFPQLPSLIPSCPFPSSSKGAISGHSWQSLVHILLIPAPRGNVTEQCNHAASRGESSRNEKTV